jgi:hypothetical protein
MRCGRRSVPRDTLSMAVIQGNRKQEKKPQISQITQIWELIHLRNL